MKRHALSTGATDRARTLRRDATEAEALLWYALREKLPAAKFRRQVPLGSYFADFASHAAKLVVEVDGNHHIEAAEHDAARTRFLNSEGYRVLRFWNNEVLQNLEGVLTRIAANLPSPLVGAWPILASSGGRSFGHAGGPKGRMRGRARQSRAPAPRAGTPHPLPSPTRGEGESVKSSDLESV